MLVKLGGFPYIIVANRSTSSTWCDILTDNHDLVTKFTRASILKVSYLVMELTLFDLANRRWAAVAFAFI